MSHTDVNMSDKKNLSEGSKAQKTIVTVEEFHKVVEHEDNPDNKLRFCIQYMGEALSQSGTPSFRNFWEARKRCMDLFKNRATTPAIRSQMWADFIELTQQARQLKKIFEEESAFTVEQITTAIVALEEEVENFPQKIEQSAKVTFETNSKTVKNVLNTYAEMQRQINFLNTHTAKIDSLRKELSATDMRIRSRNQIYQRLSLLGDHFFPRRKELIKKISQQFKNDVESFVCDNPLESDSNQMLHHIREEIKSLQAFAKQISLSTPVFMKTRATLSKYWDRLKVLEKERKKQRNEMKGVYKENSKEISKQLDEFREEYAQGSMSTSQANAKLSTITQHMQSLELGNMEKRVLSDEIKKEREQIHEQKKIKQREQRQQKQDQRNDFYQSLEDFEKNAESYDGDTLEKMVREVIEKIAQVNIEGTAEEMIRLRLEPMKDLILEKRHKESLHAEQNHDEKLELLHTILEEKQTRRNEIRQRYKQCRKGADASGLDFEKAMFYQDQLLKERERAEKIDRNIEEIEEQIDELNNL